MEFEAQSLIRDSRRYRLRPGKHSQHPRAVPSHLLPHRVPYAKATFRSQRPDNDRSETPEQFSNRPPVATGYSGRRPRRWEEVNSKLDVRLQLSSVKDRDLLPDLPREPVRKLLDIVDGIKRDRIIELLHIEGCQFTDQGEHLAAIVEISRQLRGSQVLLW